MTFIDFFAGVGGFRRGLELAGHKCLGFCEYDKFAVQSYRAIHDTEGEWYAKDIRTVRADDIPRADIWCAGFPCQDISVAGKQLGFKGKRSSLFFTVTGLIRELEEKDKPTYLFFENVKNLLSVNRGFDFARLIVELGEIGYDAEWCVFNSADVIPQNRERVFIIGRLRGRNGQQVLPIGDSDTKTDKLQRQVCNTITAGQRHSIGTYVIENQQHAQEVIYQLPRGNNKGGMHDIAPALTSNCYEHNNLLVKTININDDNEKERPQQDRIYNINGHMTALSSQLNGRYNVAVPVVRQIGNYCPSKTRDNPNQGRVYDINGISPTLSCMGGGNREPAITVPCLTPDRANKRQNGRRFKNNNDPMFTLTSQDKHGVLVGGLYTNDSKDFARGPLPKKSRCLKANKHDAGVIFYNGQKCHIRKLTPLECWRLQAWDDESFFRAFFLDKTLAHKFNIAYQRHKNNPVRLMQWAYKHQKMSDSQLYKQAGNGVTVEVIRRIGLNFKED